MFISHVGFVEFQFYFSKPFRFFLFPLGIAEEKMLFVSPAVLD